MEGNQNMESQGVLRCTAFEGTRCIASGDLAQVVLQSKAVIDAGPEATVLIFDDITSETIEVDFRGSAEEVLGRLEKSASAGGPRGEETEPQAPRGPGRPKLGVVAREVTLLPRHWEWLNAQPGGASVALRKLVEEARRINEGKDRLRRVQESAYRFMSIMAGNLPGYEEAIRALFANDLDRLKTWIREWPDDLQAHLLRLVEEPLSAAAPTSGSAP